MQGYSNRAIMAHRYPVRSRQIRRYGPAPRINVGPSIHGAGKGVTNFLAWNRKRNDEKLKAQNTPRHREENNGKVTFVSDVGSEQGKGGEHTINMKMKAERIAQERAQVVRDLRKQELGREKLQHDKHELAERMRSNVGTSQTWHGGQIAVKESKSVDLTEAREAHVTGES